MIREATAKDAEPVSRIYNHYIESSVISFEVDPVSRPEMADRIAAVQENGYPWMVLEEEEGGVAGYAYGSCWSERSAYENSVEVSIYLDPDCCGRGLGAQLYRALISKLQTRPFHAIIGGIALPNDASVQMHEKLGFEKVAHFREVGFKFGRWIDVGYWQLPIPPESETRG